MEISESSGVDGTLGESSFGASDRSSVELEFLCSGDIGGSSGLGDRASSNETDFLTLSSFPCLLLFADEGEMDDDDGGDEGVFVEDIEARDAKAKADASSVGSTLFDDLLSLVLTSAAITFRRLVVVVIIGLSPPSLIRLSTRLT